MLLLIQVITAHHRGMLYLRICDSPNLTEECLEKFPPLERVDYEDSELAQAQPINEKYPFLYYLRPICYYGQTGIGDGNMSAMRTTDIYDSYPKMQAKFRLPQGLSCEKCVMQMYVCDELLSSYALFPTKAIKKKK